MLNSRQREMINYREIALNHSPTNHELLEVIENSIIYYSTRIKLINCGNFKMMLKLLLYLDYYPKIKYYFGDVLDAMLNLTLDKIKR